jgi:pyridoxamine 5'-phosphate oxidase
VERVPEAESDDYFASRPRGAQLGAWASAQSSVVDSRAEVTDSMRWLEQRFQGREVPRPSHWGGYVLSPSRVEFWQGQPDRLHDRIAYVRFRGGWRRERLSP